MRTSSTGLVTILTLMLAACGGSDAASGTDAAPTADAGGNGADAALLADATPAAFTLVSPSLTEGSAFDPANTCTGVDTSPVLMWTPGPVGTLSYAVLLVDQSINLVHWAIYDIPAGTHALPANVDKTYQPANVSGAHQAPGIGGNVIGYLGPCPPEQHTYQFTVVALDVATLPGTSPATTRDQAQTLITAHALAAATLSGTYAQP